MGKVLKELKVITGSYTDKNGMKKNRYIVIGSIVDTKTGPMLKLDTMPIKEGGWSGWAYINDPEIVNSSENNKMPSKNPRPDFIDDDDIPF